MKNPKIIISNKVYIPMSEVSMPDVEKNYTKRIYEDKACSSCEYRPERHGYMCDACPAFKEEIILYHSTVHKGVEYIGLPIGDKASIEKKAKIDFDDFKIVDKRTISKFHYPISFTANLRPGQRQLTKDFLKSKYGLIVAPPRSGKTITMLNICLKLGQRTLILANQHEFLTQFMDHIHGNEEEGIPKCTNLPELEKKYGKKLYGIPKTDEDYKNFQFFFMPYQSLISEANGKDRLAKLNKVVGTLAVDEVHTANAKCFASTISSIKARYKLGCSATVARKDKKEFLSFALLGPVTAMSTVEALTPTVYIHKTDLPGKRFDSGNAGWVKTCQYISRDEDRNKLLVQQVLKDLEAGHNLVIPVNYVEHVKLLQKSINDAYGSEICGIFTGSSGGSGEKNKKARKEVLSAAKANEIRVVVGIRSILRLGLNVPSWSAIYLCLPISNEPNLKQETARVCTPKEGKPNPIIRLFVDFNQGISLGCARSSINHMKKFSYDFSQSTKQKELYHAVMSNTKSYKNEHTPQRTGLLGRKAGYTAD